MKKLFRLFIFVVIWDIIIIHFSLWGGITIKAFYKYIASRIAEARQKANLTQAQAAELIGITDKYLGRIENGNANVSMDKIVKIASVLNCTPEDFFHGSSSVFNAVTKIDTHKLTTKQEKLLNEGIDYLIRVITENN